MTARNKRKIFMKVSCAIFTGLISIFIFFGFLKMIIVIGLILSFLSGDLLKLGN